MPQVIHVERDEHGLQLAVQSLFEESLIRQRMKGAMENSPSQLARLEAEIPAREISPGYYTRANYLIGLSNALELGIPMEPSSLTASDVLGIRAVRSARATYEREHPACGRCGERQDNAHMRNCWSCNFQLRGKEN